MSSLECDGLCVVCNVDRVLRRCPAFPLYPQGEVGFYMGKSKFLL